MFLWFNLDCAFFLTNSIEIKLISITIKQTNGGEGGELWVYGTAECRFLILIDVSKNRNVLMYILLFQNTKQVIKVTTLLNYLQNMDRNVILSH